MTSRIHLFVICVTIATASAATAQESALADALREFDSRVIVVGKVRENPLASMLPRDAKAQLRDANLRDAKAWAAVNTLSDWKAFRKARIEALRKSLGSFPPPPKDLKVRITRSRNHDGFAIDNLVYESRPGVLVAANLYRPIQPKALMSGIVIVLSHQRPKHNGQRQDMAMTWARAGCVVLIPDHLGHGERAVHPFTNAEAYKGAFAVDRQDYWFRHDLGMQLHLIGDSLMGWLTYDLSRGIDVLRAQKGVDPERIILISEPAGGGDVAAVTMAINQRVTDGVITNFGGAQPETAYPLPRDAEQSFEYAGSGSWESTRNLTYSARDGFLHWTIVAGAAPRNIVYNHEFYWDEAADPVWKRLKKVYGLHKLDESLVGVGARGFVVGSPPENWHWLPTNRALLYPIFERWFGIPNPKTEYNNRRPENELLCFTEDTRHPPVHELIARLGNERADAARTKLAALKPDARRAQLRKDWAKLLGDVEPAAGVRRIGPEQDDAVFERMRVERHHLSVEPGILVPMILLVPPQGKREKVPLVVGVAQAGKQEFLHKRADTIAALLRNGIAVALPDVRGTGETSPGATRDRGSPSTSISATGLMTGQTLLGGRVRDLRTVVRYLKQHPELDTKRIALWGDSFTEPIDPDRNWKVPHGVDNRPVSCEPLGGLLALLGGIYEDDVRVVYANGGLASYTTALSSPFCYLPHDAVVPGALTAGDVSDIAAALAPRPIRLTGLVDGVNRRIGRLPAEKLFEPTRSAYRTAKAEDVLTLEPSAPAAKELARWFADQLR